MLRSLVIAGSLLTPLLVLAAEDETAAVSFTQLDGALQIVIGERTVAEYVLKDQQILRPFFRNLRTRSGLQVTRNHPPVKGQDLDDHATMHPGLWLAFGDISGFDFWRNKSQVRHVRFVRDPQGGANRGSFTVESAYEADGRILCREECEIAIVVNPVGYRIHWDSTFRAEGSEIQFGDQEEMGLGVRVATPLAVVRGGHIIDSDGRENEKLVWGKQANWSEYSGVIEGARIGIVLMPDPQNFRQSWFHARNYGLLVANPFGRNAFTKGEKSKITVKRGDEFRLRFGVVVYSASPSENPDIDVIYRDFLANTARDR